MIKNYLRIYISYTQDDWIDYLPMTEFLVNNNINKLTEMISFFEDNGFNFL